MRVRDGIVLRADVLRPSQDGKFPKPRQAMVVTPKYLRTAVGEIDQQQRVSAGTPSPLTDLGKLQSELFTEPSEWEIGSEQCGDEKGEYSNFPRCFSSLARSVALGHGHAVV